MDNATKKTIEEQIEKLAIMVAKGFAATATKGELGDLQTGMSELRTEMSDLRTEMNDRFDKVDFRIDKIHEELDGIRDNARVLKTRVDKLEVAR